MYFDNAKRAARMKLLAGTSNLGSVRTGLIFVLAILALAGVIGYLSIHRSPASLSAPESTDRSAIISVAHPSRHATSGEASQPGRAPRAPVAPTQTAAAPPPELNLPRTQETPQAARAIDKLTQLGSTNSIINSEQGEEISARLKEIINVGTPAVAAIHDFLQKNVDLNFGKSAPDSNSSLTLRTALINALGSIGGPESIAVGADTLQKTAVPLEIGLLAKMLEQQAPGQYRDAAVAASREALMASAKTPNSDHGDQEVAPLFQILQNCGDASVVSDLQNLSSQWRYYGMIAMGNLPDGQGVPALTEMATAPGAQAAGSQQVAFQVLAELAPTNPDAQAVLVEQAKLGHVPNWNEVAMALSGARLEFGQDLFADPGKAGNITQTHYVAFGNQNFRTANYDIPEAQLEQQRALIDQLLSLTTDAVGREALQRAKENLQPKAN